MTHLWEVDHPYYCALGNYFSNDVGARYDSWDDFLEEFGNSDMDYNLLFRWDWQDSSDDDAVESDKLYVFWIAQRKGFYRFDIVDVKKEDEERVRKFLEKRFRHLKSLWEPLE